jgi:adenylate cyclase
VKQVARELGVRYVLEGSVRKAGIRVRITGQLIDTSTGAHIWADRFDGTLDGIFELQDQVASSVAGAIEPALRQSEIERAARKPTDNLDAYDLYLRALSLVHRYDGDSLKAAVPLLWRALAIDAVYAPAAALLGWVQVHLRMQGWQVMSEADMALALCLARQALAARFDDSDTMWQSAAVLYSVAGETATALAILDRALAINPNSARAWVNRGYICAYGNQPEAAVEAFQLGARLSPFDPLSFFYALGFAVAHLGAGRFEKGIEYADRALRDNPRMVPALRAKIAASAHLGRLDEARAACDQLRALYPGLTVGTLRTTFHLGAAAEMVELQIAGLRLAGLPE